MYPQGGTIGYFYGREAFEMMQIPEDGYDNSHWIKAGTIITYADKQFKVQEVSHMLYKERQRIDRSFGVNLESPHEADGYEYDAAIVVVADELYE